MFTEGTYSDARRRRNRQSIGLIVVGGIAACMVAAALTSWRWSNAFATSALVVAFGSALWWMFASRKAGPIGLEPGATQRLKRTFWVK